MTKIWRFYHFWDTSLSCIFYVWSFGPKQNYYVIHSYSVSVV